ncbi:MAG: DUF4417 domain-containing protein [Lachnospiraceae bacterium]|nr:DUF4417 domain-containing protein [Lachnospiraceae bacterium]
MSNNLQKSCKDVFNAFLVEDATYDGYDEFPCVKTSSLIPNRVITFTKALKTNDYDQWVVFYEHDYQFERIWNRPKRYLEILKRFRGVISPDFSLYRNMPICMQKWNTYRNRALAHWWQKNGIEVIPNVRFAGRDSYQFCFKGIEKNSTVCIGSIGCMRSKTERLLFTEGLDEMVRQLTPKIIIVYGSAPNDIFDKYRKAGIRIIVFKSEFASFHAKEVK